MADDIGRAIIVDEAVVEVLSRPAYGGGDGVVVGQRRVPALVRLGADGDGLDVAVGGDGRDEQRSCGQGGGSVHLHNGA